MSSSFSARHNPEARIKPKRSKFTISNQTKTHPSTGVHVSMFENAKKVQIESGSFSISVNNGSSLEILYKRVAPNGILNAGGRADEVRCHPGTREEVIDRVEKWGNAKHDQAAPIFWLSGPAGAGKSAIVQTVAERCEERGVPHANFFFFRGDPSRAHASPLIATLLHQIILLYPSLQGTVAAVLSTNPLIFDSSLENQLVQLIITPLESIQQSSSAYCPLLLLVDGLDECDSESKRSQRQILEAFDKILTRYRAACPFRLLLASRDEAQIRTGFNRISSQSINLYLNDDYSPQKDIRVFVNAQFESIKRIHPLHHTLDANWPSAQDINYIVEKSSGHFIYAATVMRFILDSSASPMLSLERILGAAKLATKSPYSNLDAIYTYILSQVDDQTTLKDILCAEIVSRETEKLRAELQLFSLGSTHRLIGLLVFLNQRYTETVVLSCLQDLTSLAKYDQMSGQIQFYHASFSDYLLDKSRSQCYFVDTTKFVYNFPLAFWELIDDKQTFSKTFWQPFGLYLITQLQELPPDLMGVLATTKKAVWPSSLCNNMSIFVKLYDLCISDDDVLNFRAILHQWFRQYNDFHLLNKIQGIPFGARYFWMVQAQHNYHLILDIDAVSALCPQSDFDCQESALWLTEVLHGIYSKVYFNDSNLYKQFLHLWISWAVDNDIPFNGLDHLPYAGLYLWEIRWVMPATAGQSTCERLQADWSGCRSIYQRKLMGSLEVVVVVQCVSIWK